MAKKKSNTKPITAEEFDEKFDRGEDVSEHLEWDKASKKVLVDLPLWLVKSLDEESSRRGIARQALIKTVLVDYADDLKSKGSRKGA